MLPTRNIIGNGFQMSNHTRDVKVNSYIHFYRIPTGNITGNSCSSLAWFLPSSWGLNLSRNIQGQKETAKLKWMHGFQKFNFLIEQKSWWSFRTCKLRGLRFFAFLRRKKRRNNTTTTTSFMTFIVSFLFVSISFHKSTSFHPFVSIIFTDLLHWVHQLCFFFQRYTDTTVCVTELGKAWLFGSKCMLCRTEICEKFIYQENQWPNWEYEFHLNGGYTL